MRWNDIDFRLGTLTVQRTRERRGTRSPKSLKSYRTLPIDGKLLVQLKLYRTWCKEKSLFFGKHLEDDDYIFISHQTGAPISDNTIKVPFDKAIKESGVRRITPHGLRHTHATILITKRPMNKVADRLGNTPEMIHKVYDRLMEEMKKESVNAFSDSLEEASSGGGFGGSS